MWPSQPKTPASQTGLIFTSAILINLALASLIYALTLSQSTAPVKRVTLGGVYFPERQDSKPQEPLPEVRLSSAPLTSSPPPPPMTLDLSALDANTGIPVPDPLWPTPDDIQQIQPPTLNFSQSGSAPGSTMQASIAMAQVVFQMPPEYPLQAKQRGIEGQVTLDLAINPEGRVEDIKLVDETPSGVFYRSASRAVLRWRFAAPMQTQWQRIVIRYELEK
ncbi:energy transducer TonB [Shewanella algae]|uniref:energy transducer TonB n=1 Tax=Shewanella TaxID=22 RepID=UPI003003E386